MITIRNLLIIAGILCAAWISESVFSRTSRERVAVTGKRKTEAVSSAGNYGFSYKANKGGVAIGDQEAEWLINVTIDGKPFEVSVPSKSYTRYYKGQKAAADVKRGLFTRRVVGCQLRD